MEISDIVLLVIVYIIAGFFTSLTHVVPDDDKDSSVFWACQIFWPLVWLMGLVRFIVYLFHGCGKLFRKGK